ncbi:MAG: hypothetical protein GX542_09425 [Rhodococcus sp.]|nr:hypothetical protein [Rhodococcus sp. (in: high G+C Gram-positive bacteria)]
MSILTNTLSSLWQVVLVGLLFGAGLPAVFALGLRTLDSGSAPADGAASADDAPRVPTAMGRIAAYVCFAVVLISIAAGILMLMSDFLASTFGIHIF